ncbi:hypothetical protein BH09ACT10_BH09ACT10_00350 [soil metagenome]
MRLSLQTELTIAVIGTALIAIGALFLFKDLNRAEPIYGAEKPAINPTLVRENSHRLDTAADNKATLVEFLDFECEACRAAFPIFEELREKYAGRITFVIRYFPITTHRNALNAALAVEAAARQDQLEPMYRRMFETQSDWGEQSASQAKLFRTFAVGLDLDMTRYDADVASESARERVALDQRDGTALGVSGTPTLFLNGEKLDLTTVDELYTSVDNALTN